MKTNSVTKANLQAQKSKPSQPGVVQPPNLLVAGQPTPVNQGEPAQTAGTGAVSACCGAEKQVNCCQPAAKATCCAPQSTSGSCGCQ